MRFFHIDRDLNTQAYVKQEKKEPDIKRSDKCLGNKLTPLNVEPQNMDTCLTVITDAYRPMDS